MPNIKSAKKRVITSRKKAVGNNVVESSRRTAIKNFEKAVKAGDKEVSSEKLNVALQRIDKSAKNGLIHKNKAARLKSRLTKMKNNME